MAAVTEREFLRVASDVLGRSDLTLSARHGADWDSVGHVNLVMEVEAHWGVRVPMARVPQLETLRDFYRLLPHRPAKALAVDADGTLWQGVVSEDGPEAVAPFVAFQRELLALRARGVMLALLSKNDPATPGSPLDAALARADMPLSLGDFACVAANWDPKPGNLRAVAGDLGIDPDAFVFLDDNPRERAEMRATLPGVMVPDPPFADLGATYFEQVGATQEDRLRVTWRPLASTDPSYLVTLGLVAVSGFATEGDLPRLVQMAAKTNRFNATTRRRTEADFRALLADPASRVFTFRCRDRFGDMGLVCYAVVTDGVCTDFVMSCRAMGRTLEWFAWREIVAACGAAPQLDYVPSDRNAPFAAFREAVLDNRIGETFCSRG